MEKTVLSPVNAILRNPNRVFHHLGLRDEKAAIIKNFFSNADEAALLKRHFKGAISTRELLYGFSLKAGLSTDQLMAELLPLYQTGLLEFHITDVCDLQCVDCHYVNKSNATIPYEEIEDYIIHLRPRAITITGGGEPNVYHSGENTLNEVVNLINTIDSDVQIGLINNNTAIPDGEWLRHIAWQRTSVDAASRASYQLIKGRDKYEDCIKNVYGLLASPIPFVGIGFLYRKENVGELFDFLMDWYERYKLMPRVQKVKFNIQFRPISPAIEDAVLFADPSLDKRMDRAVTRVKEAAAADSDFGSFLENVTNFYGISNVSGSYFTHRPQSFKRCHNALLHRVLRSNGDEYPDFLLCNFKNRSMGNVLTAKDRQMERVRIGLNSVYYHLCLDTYCNGAHCRQGWVSSRIEAYDKNPDKTLNLTESKFF